MPVRPLGVRLGPVRVVRPGGCIARRIVVSRRCASPGPPSQEANRRRRVLWHGRCSLHWRVGLHPRTRFGRARYMGSFVHGHGPTRHTRRPIAGLSHNHADPDPRTNDRGETTLGPPTQFAHWTPYLNAAQANLKFPSQFFAGLVQPPSPATAADSVPPRDLRGSVG